MPETHSTTNANRILAALPADEYERLAPHLQPVTLTLSEILFRTDDTPDHVYFPTASIVSLLTDLSDGTGMESGLVGSEGMVGVSAILGGVETKTATVQLTGDALKLKAVPLQEEFRRGGVLQSALLRYTHALMAQISQSVVCNARHAVEARLARWLLMFRDRVHSDEFELTHEFMSSMLGVRRASVSEAASHLQERNLIQYNHGRIRIADRPGLEAFACECYPVVKEKFERFLL
jgi:CRP-like cAMP-binding protein